MIDDIFTFENLYEAYKKCRQSKQHKNEVIRFEINLAHNLQKLVDTISKNTYKINGYKTFIITDPKKRNVEALSFKDRMVNKCLCDVALSKRIERKLIFDNCACREGKGTLFARNRLVKFLHDEFYRNNKSNDFYFLKVDIAKYFPSINHHVLIWQLKDCGFSKEELKFIWDIIKAGEYMNKKEGLPLGNQSSQWFALLYLNKVDRFIKEDLRIKGYIRYMDDMILLHNDKKYLQECLMKIRKICNSELKLLLNEPKTQIGQVKNGIDFLGFNHKMTETGKVNIKLRQSAKIRLRRYIKTMNELHEKEVIDDEYMDIRKKAFIAHLKYCDDNLLSNIFNKKVFN